MASINPDEIPSGSSDFPLVDFLDLFETPEVHRQEGGEQDDTAVPAPPEFLNRRTSTEVLLERASAAAVVAAETNQESDSVLSAEEEDLDDADLDDYDNDQSHALAPSASIPASEEPPLLEDFRRMSVLAFRHLQESSVEQTLAIHRQNTSDDNNNDSQTTDANTISRTPSNSHSEVEDYDMERNDVEALVVAATEEETDEISSRHSWEHAVFTNSDDDQQQNQQHFEMAAMEQSERDFFRGIDLLPNLQTQQQTHKIQDHKQQQPLQHNPPSTVHLAGIPRPADDVSIGSSHSEQSQPFSTSCTLPQLPPHSRSVQDILIAARVLDEDDLRALKQVKQQHHLFDSLLLPADPPHKSNGTSNGTTSHSCDDDAEVFQLYYVFSNFTTPAPPYQSVQAILELERKAAAQDGRYDTDARRNVPLPTDCVVTVSKKCKVLSILTCRTQQLLLQFPRPFYLAFFRILIRLLTNECDDAYQRNTLLVCEWRPPKIEQPGLSFFKDQFQVHPEEVGERDSAALSRLKSASNTGDGMGFSKTTANSAASGVKMSPKPGIFWTASGDDGSRDYNSRRANQIYNMARLQQSGTTAAVTQSTATGIAATSSDQEFDKLYASKHLLRFFSLIKDQKTYRYLLAPVARMLGLLCTAGVSELVLRRMLTLASSPVTPSSPVHPVVRLLLVRALQTAADGASRSFLMMGKASLRHFFSFSGGPGIVRTISGLTSWPFRNDFCTALWFRAETLEACRSYPILVSVRAEDGGGIEISLMPLEDDKSSTRHSKTTAAAVLAVSIFDSDPRGAQNVEVQRLRMPGCILLPRVWYHVSIRHTRSRLKGVFSLSTRQQVSIMLDGKVMLTEHLNFPKVSDEDFVSDNKAAAFLQKAVLRSSSRAGLSLTINFGSNFQGQTGNLYLFHENVSDATLRSLYEVSAGSAGTLKRVLGRVNGWDSHHGDIVRKSRLLDVSMKSDDAEEIVLSHRRVSTGGTGGARHQWGRASQPGSSALAVVDFGEGEDEEYDDDLPLELSMVNFGSKLFLVWDSSRSLEHMALELHIGAHVKMREGGVQSWHVEGAQDVISSLGGVQCLIPLFHSLLCGDIERSWLNDESECNNRQHWESYGTFSKECLWSLIPDLLFLVASFVQDHGENAREMLRCGGIDIIETCIAAARKAASSDPRLGAASLFGALTAIPPLTQLLIDSILRLQSSCSHYTGLETKIFTRLLFNVPLWFVGSSRILGVSLDVSLLPILSSIARANPDKVRDCVGITNFVLLLRDYINAGESETSSMVPVTNSSHGDYWRGPLTGPERRHMSSSVLGMIFLILASGTHPRDLSPFLNLLSFSLDSEWDESSQEMGEKNQIIRSGSRAERYNFAVSACTVLLFLLQMKPAVPNFVVSFAHCCESTEGGAGWILCSMVNSFDDTIRSLGVRCIAAYMDLTAKSPDAPLSLGFAPDPEAPATTTVDASATPGRMQSSRLALLAVGKGLAAMGPGVRSVVLPPSKLTARVTYKLLWHLLKGHRSRIGKKSHAALLHLVIDDVGTPASSLSSLEFLLETFVIPDDVLRGGFRLCHTSTKMLLEETNLSPVRTLRDGLGISTVIRLLRYLSSEIKDQFLMDLLKLAKSSPTSVQILCASPDWQPCLFHLISETIEKFTSRRSPLSSETDLKNLDSKDATDGEESSNGIFENPSDVEARLDICLDLYATLLGHSIRGGGDKALSRVEDAASLQRVCVNGHDVFCLILSRLVSELCENGTIVLSGNFGLGKGERLKESARLVTDAILSSGTEGLDMTSAVRCWRCLRHLTAVTVAIVTKSGFGVGQLFDYRNLQSSAVDRMSGGLCGLRLPESWVPPTSAHEYRLYVEASGAAAMSGEVREREIYRRLCVTLSAQVLAMLDAFIFPDSLDASLPASQLHGLDLVRNCEPRLGTAQGPLIASAIRLSLLLLCHLEPCGIKLLQCASRLRCLLHWALELIRESTALEGFSAAFQNLTAPLDRLVLAIVLQCHRTLGRCSALVVEIESASYEKYFASKDSQKRYYRRLLRVALELRDAVSTAFRGRNEVLRAALTGAAYDALRDALESPAPSNKNLSKEALMRLFLLENTWVIDFQDVVMLGDIAVPEQVETGSNQQLISAAQGLLAVEQLHNESKSILDDFEKALNSCFERYLQAQRNWAETGLVRELEYQGDETVKRLAGKHRNDSSEAARAVSIRSVAAESRWVSIHRKVSEPWSSCSHWKLAKHTDRLGQRILFVRNRNFDSHAEASYDLTLGKELEKEEKDRAERLRQNEQLAEVMRRNTNAIVPYDLAELVGGDDDEMIHVSDSDAESSVDTTDPTGVEDEDSPFARVQPLDGVAHEEEWDKIENEEIEDDAWAKAFIWSEFESVVARFESVQLVTLQSVVEGKLLLTSHGLYFRQIGDEISVMSKERVGAEDAGHTTSCEANDRRWRMSRLTEVLGRRYMLRVTALELFFSDSHELFLNFSGGTKERDRFHAKLRNSCKIPMLRSPKSLNPRSVFKRSRLVELWKKRKISNFDYLMELNKMAGRTFNDIMQYPVFPWILSDYTSDTIDLTDSRVYRDLTKPIGALNPNRLAQLLERYNEFAEFGLSEQERFLYGSHYSSPGVVLHFLMRQEPFASMHIELQSGRFDCPDRLFYDISQTWLSCMTSTSDMKELVPEFFTLPEMFLNTNKFPLGRTQTGREVGDVGLPPWANGSAFEFVRVHRLALESEYVSQNLNHWVDLIFGYKQRGQAAEVAHNVFHYLSYEGSVDLDKIVDEIDRAAAESQIQNFGQTPSQLLVKEPHPSRGNSEECWKYLIQDPSVAKRLRCYTPSKQFAVKKNSQAQRSSVAKIHVFSDSVFAVYADLSMGTYRWSPTSKRGRLKADKLRPLARRELSRSHAVIKRRAAVGQSIPSGIGNSSFAFTVGGAVKEEQRQKNLIASSRLIASKGDSLGTLQSAGYLVSCGYWDNVVKVHTVDGQRLLRSDSGGHRGPILCLKVDGQDGGLMVTGGQDCTCRIWVLDHPDMAVALSDGYAQTALGSTNNGDQLLSCCRVLWGHETPVSCLDLNSGLDVVVSGSMGGVMCVHTLRLGEYIRSFRPPLLSKRQTGVSKLCLHKNGILVAHMEDWGLHTFTVNGVRLSSKDAGEQLHDMQLCSDGEILVTGGERCHVLIRSTKDLEILSMLDLSRHGPIRSISLTPDDLNPIPQVMFIGSDDGMITIVDEDPSYSGIETAETLTF